MPAAASVVFLPSRKKRVNRTLALRLSGDSPMERPSRRSIVFGLTAVSGATLLAQPAGAQDYPQRPVRVIVPYAAGGASDILARLVTTQVGQLLGQSLFVDNRGGGASIIGTQAIAGAAPDGYTIGIIDTAFTINPGLFRDRLPYDTKRDFLPVSFLAQTPLVLVVHSSLPVNTAQELITMAKAKPGTMTMASGGLGTAIHLGCEQFRQVTGIDVIHVPYRGGGPAIVDLLAAKVDFTFSTIPAVLEQVRAGKLRALGMTTGRAATMPGVPSMAEVGLPSVDAAPEFGMVAPAGTPAAIVAKLSEVAQAAVKTETLRTRMREIGYDPIGNSPEDYAVHIDREIVKWMRIIAAGNIKPE
jgi:tripartite-type tricarboxylate transporter receptor subunit TctC